MADTPYPLTPNQIKILEMASDGLTDKEISHSLGVSPGTLRTYWDRMRKRCDSRSRSEVIAKMQHGLSARRLRLVLLEKMPFYIWTLRSDGSIEYVNEWFTSKGCLSRKEALRHGLTPLVSETDRDAFPQFIEHGLRGGQVFDGLWPLRVDGPGLLKQHKVRVFPLEPGLPDRWIAYARELAEDADAQMSQFLRAILA